MKTQIDTHEQVAAKREEEIQRIAREILFFETLETRNSDGLDFRDTAVWNVREALKAAFNAGLKAAG